MESRKERLFKNLIIDVSCAKCGKIVFSLPYIYGVTHSLRCHECGETTIIAIDEKGGISQRLQEDLDALDRRFSEIKDLIMEELVK